MDIYDGVNTVWMVKISCGLHIEGYPSLRALCEHLLYCADKDFTSEDEHLEWIETAADKVRTAIQAENETFPLSEEIDE